MVHSQFRQINYLRHKFPDKLPNDSATAWMKRERKWHELSQATRQVTPSSSSRQKGRQMGGKEAIEDDQPLPPANQQRPSVWGNLLIATKSLLVPNENTVTSLATVVLQRPTATYQDLVDMSDLYFAWMTIVVFSCTVFSLSLSCCYLVWQARSSRANNIRLPFGPTFHLIYSQKQWSSKNTIRKKNLF